MSNNKMLIDATHPEETRVVVLRNGRVEEFDFESAARKLLRGNIYLAKVTRVEPSLQAAFVEYGGNRHGFLAFNEIHPDYYQIPVADRQALIEEEAAAEAAEEAAVDAHAEALARRQRRSGGGGRQQTEETVETVSEVEEIESAPQELDDEPAEVIETGARTLAESSLPEDDRLVAPEADNEDADVAANENTRQEQSAGEATSEESRAEAPAEGGVQEVASASGEVERVEQVGSAEDALEELPSRPRRRPRSYKIQEVIKRRQVILVQVVKEERGNKGAALTTYLSLAGRYTVLMPNTARGGGISRKITNPQDRKRLKAIAAELEVPDGMGLIIRTAGASRTKQEIKRDFEYLLRLWESVRELTLQSQAPSLVYEEGNLIKRSIRDLYNKDVEEIVVAGDEAFKEAKEFMRMLMPSHAKNVLLYQEPEPLFTRYQIERQLNAMFSPYVTLRSGGYLVINQTEALVAIDVNSGKATREFSIEETAYNTNLEAADEIARQLKLRDLAGLIVVDFIDMEEKRNNRSVERRLKEALRFDRARIQVGRISHFGLLEMSRQRLRTGVLEGSTSQCPHCQGTGIIRSTESVALAVLRGLEDAITGGARTPLVASTTPSVALYILNNKRPFINDMEGRHGLPITILGSDKLAGANFTIERGAAPVAPQRRTDRGAVNMEWGFEDESEAEGETREQAPRADGRQPEERSGDEGGGRRRRRRRRRGGRREDRPEGNGHGAHGGGHGDGHGGGERAHAHSHRDFGDEDGDTAGEGDVAAHPHDHDHDSEHEHEHLGQEGGDEQSPEARGQGEERRPRGRRRGRRGGRRGRERRNTELGAAGEGQQPDAGQPGFDAHEHGAPGENGHGNRDEARGEGRGEGRSHERHGREPRRFDEGGSEERTQREPRHGGEMGEGASAGGRRERHEPASREHVSHEHATHEPVAREQARAEPETRAEPPRRRHEGSSEPKIERIVVGEERARDTEPASDSAPARKGWWQRKLGGE